MSPSTNNRPLLLRARPDVVAAAVRVAGLPRWVVTDPVTLEHYDLSDQEYTLLGALREGVSLRDLQRVFETRFAPRRITLEQVWEFVSRLHRAGLAVSTAAGQGGRLVERRDDRVRTERLWSWTQLLAIRLPGLRADGFITSLYGVVRWAFSPPALLLAIGLVLWAATIAVTDYAAFVAGMPAVAELARPGNVAALMLAAVGVKVLHELGHALACKHFGGRVHELGVLLLAFTPAMYCDVSDLWRLPSKRQRMLVTAAGIVTEVMLASLAAIVWRYTDAGLVHTAALNVMIVCTVGTLLINANPLLRYDGYYLLSDFTETPNLWQRSRDAVAALWGDWLRRHDVPRPPIRPWWLPVYGLASQVYLVLVLLGIVWALTVALHSYRLQNLAYAIGVVAAAASLSAPLRSAWRTGRDPIARRRLRRGRAGLTVVIVAAIAAALWFVPIGFNAEGQATVALSDPAVVVTTTPGRIVSAVAAGQRVEAGDQIARLENPELTAELAALGGRLAEERLRLKQLGALRAHDRQASDQLPAAASRVEDLEHQLTQLEQEAERLVLRSPRAGVVVSSERRDADRDRTTLARWSGTPLSPSNRGAWLEVGASVCCVGEPASSQAEVLLTEDDIERVAIGQPVEIAWRQTPGVVAHGRVVAVSRRAAPLGSRGASPTTDNGPRYQVRVELADPPAGLRVGGQGRVKIDTGATTLGNLAVTRLRQLFRLP
ncbi:putative peptide zinc metalloprotease protein YydH [Posidoniimonas polymericola]|uniref:Putative peptide zinc metalloprotease protein YydH n=1 Tax=Posidoniimonas polymericola TaxID=2528002 RepID=A0A5C5YRY7_9BACT|nr:HlyD family efflux transporter periplasmic adaptor subunit [Posidoniimonas polymericola]TWT77628.1 putative peptide zinc metalloprotease protein YydH [Posidoniimonas polymericola]